MLAPPAHQESSRAQAKPLSLRLEMRRKAKLKKREVQRAASFKTIQRVSAAARKFRRHEKSYTRAIHGHARAHGKRRQAQRDKKGR